ncbi:MAG: hypothetical protein PVF47_20075 [Anaerolineae bacterium]
MTKEQFLEGMMDRETITAEDLLRDIYQAESELRWFEQKHTLLSENFYQLYQQGHLRDEDPVEIREYLEWAGWWEIYQDRRERYQRAIEHQLKQLTTPASLDDLHISKLKISA